jgi:hypothetical protein
MAGQLCITFIKVGTMNLGPRARLFALLCPPIVAAISLAFADPIPQDLAYHNFADCRRACGIPYFGDVLSNLAFLVAGGLGLLALRRGAGDFEQFSEGRLFAFFFASVILTGLGSAWYHWAPDNERLFWDRLPMTLLFMTLLAILLSDHVSPRCGVRSFWPLMLSGMGSTVYWLSTERAGAGDLRPYALVQFGSIMVLPLILLLYRSRYTHAHWYWGALGWYILAKVAEQTDHQVYAWGHILSGHNLKHIFAALACGWLAPMLVRRTRRTSATTF